MPSNSSTDAEGHSYEHQFPNEIIDEVVDHLHGNNEALKAISLSSRIFLHSARKHLFAIFVLQAQNIDSDTSVPSRKIFRLIKSAPHLIPYIQVLEISGPEDTSCPEFDKEFSKALGLFQQTLETEITTSSLRHLYLDCIDWSHLSIDIRAAIQRLLGFRSLKMVTFYRASNIPWTIFKKISPSVTALTLDFAFFWPEGETDSDDEWCKDPARDLTKAPLIKESGDDRSRIEALYIAYGTLGIDPTIILAHDPICLALDLTHPRTFWVQVLCNRWWIRHQEFISHVSCSLETLGINFSFFCDKTLPSLDCCQLHNVKHLCVQTSDTFGRFGFQSAFLWLCESLETLPRQHQWQSIVIRCVIGIEECIDYQSERGSWPEVKKGLGWEHIDMFLTQPRFDSLPQIRVNLGQGPEVKRPDYNAFLRSASVLLPRLMAKGIVVLDNYKKEHRPPY